ncbi:MAG: hypothetical protein J6S73_02575 [Lentisphaeria bacterium]|nr:hypothetical protein [Lentisphaeria bacterium]
MIWRFPVITAVLLAVTITADGATRREDMQQDAALTSQALEQYQTFPAWSSALHEAREKFNQNRPEKEKVYSHAQFGNFPEAMQSIRKACDELGLDFMIVRLPTPAEKAFAASHDGQAPDPYIYLMQQLLAQEKIEMAETLGKGRKPLAQRLKERYPAEEYSRKILVFGNRKDLPELDADFIPCSGNGAYLANDVVLAGKKELLNRPVILFAAPAELLYRECGVLPSPALLDIPAAAYRKIETWDGSAWPRLGYEPLPEPEDEFFKILPNRSLQIAPVLTGADSGIAGTLRLPLPDPPGSGIRLVLLLAAPAQLEVRATCGRDKVRAGVLTDKDGSRVELRIRPAWLSRMLTLQFHVCGKARLRAIHLYRAD